MNIRSGISKFTKNKIFVISVQLNLNIMIKSLLNFVEFDIL